MFSTNPGSLYHLFVKISRLQFLHAHTLLEPLGLYPGQPPLLFALARKDGLKQKDLASQLYIQPATLTIMLKRMEGAGLVERRQDCDDQRISRVYLTRQGKEACNRVKAVVNNMEEKCFGGMSKEEQEQLRHLLLQIQKRLAQPTGKKEI